MDGSVYGSRIDEDDLKIEIVGKMKGKARDEPNKS